MNMNSAMTKDKLTIAISSRALFSLDESHVVFENEGVDAYCRYQIEHEDIPLNLGVAFSLVKKLMPLYPRVEVILLSRNSVDTAFASSIRLSTAD